MATIQGVYLALFGRPADPTGLAFFNSVTGNGTNLAGIGDLANTAEYQTRFTGKSNAEIIESIYQSLFGRAGDPVGVNFFLGELAAGRQTINTIAINILDGALGSDLQIVSNKLVASNLFTNALNLPNEAAAYSGTSAADIGRNFLSTITADPSTIPSLSQTDAAVLLLLGGTPTPSNALTIFSDNLTGTSGADKYTAAQAEFFTAIDTIDGGGGSDSITITAVTASPSAASPTMTNVESMTVTGTGGLNLDFGKITGLNNVIYDATGDLTASNVSSELFVFGSNANGSTTDATFSMASGQSTLKLMLNGTNSVDADIAQLKTGTASIINIESIGPQGSIPNGQSNNTVNSISYVGENASGATFNITGDASTSIAGGFQNAVTIDGGAHKGDLYITGSIGSDVFTGGSGNNTFNGLDGQDVANLLASAGQVDTIRLNNTKSFNDKTIANTFEGGVGGDIIELNDSNTTHSNTGNASLGVISSLPVAGSLAVDSFDVFEFTTLFTKSLGGADAGTIFFDKVGFGLTSALGTSAYFVAYDIFQSAALFYFENNSTTTISDGDVQLVGTFNGVSLGGLDASNFNFV